jgi:sugar lactone lactonase YvrE
MTRPATFRIGCTTVAALLGSIAAVSTGAQTALFESRQLTPAGEYTYGIEGPAVDTRGDLYVVNYQKRGTIGRLREGATKSEMFLELPAGSIANSIRIGPDLKMYIADYTGHNVFVLEDGEPRVYFHSDQFNQPNDLTVAADGTIYASDPHWKRRDGQVWRIVRGPDGLGIGTPMTTTRKLTTTNGIDLSPDGKTLYVGESETRQIWAYRIDGTNLVMPRLVRKFDDFSIDGLRVDVTGRIFVTRILKGTVAILSPDGKVEREVRVSAKEPTNLAFGGRDGKTVFVTQRQGGFIETFRSDRPGREFCLQLAKGTDAGCR